MNIHKQIKSILTEMAANLLVGTDTQDKEMIEDADFDKVNILIKQSILKAIMEETQKIEQDYFEGEGCDAYDGYDIGFDNCKREFESVIKEVLSK